MKPNLKGACAALAVAMLILAAPAAAEEDPAVVQEVLDILKDRGLVDEARYTELVARNQTWEEGHQSLFDRIEWLGDMRQRFEGFWYKHDPTGNNRDNRFRMRWRLRLGAKVPVNEWVTAGFRLATDTGTGFGKAEARSTNVTYGGALDFEKSGVYVDQAFLDFKIPTFQGVKTHLVLGKMDNPFRWKKGKDYLVWDPDITPEGAVVKVAYQATEDVQLVANTGYFIFDENSRAADGHFYALQAGGDWKVTEEVTVGGRGTWYSFHALDAGFFNSVNRALFFGNTSDLAKDGDGINVLEFSAFTTFDCFEDWPITVVGNFVQNLDAGDALGSEQSQAFGGSIEVGDKAKWFLLGGGYYYSEANYFPAMFTDSDLFDGRTNRKGWALYGAKTILPNTDLKFSLFGSRAVDNSIPPYAASVIDSDRIRMRTDIEVKF